MHAQYRNDFEMESDPVVATVTVEIVSTIEIEDPDQDFTPSRYVDLTLTSEHADSMRVWNEGEAEGEAWELGSEDANAIALFVTSLANGKKMNMAYPKVYKISWVETGEGFFKSTKLSENNSTCESCHQSKGRTRRSRDKDSINLDLRGTAATYPNFTTLISRSICFCTLSFSIGSQT